MEHKFTKTTGNFKYTVTYNTDATTPLGVYLHENGLVREIQGAVLQGWEKGIAYPNGKRKDMPKVTDEVTGELRDWSRNDIPFTPENADALMKAISDFKIDIGTAGPDGKHVENLVDNGILDVEVEKYEGAAAAVPKFKAEKELLRTYLFEGDGTTPRKLKSGEDRTVASFCASRGLAEPTEPWEEDTEFLAAVKAWQKAQAANQD